MTNRDGTKCFEQESESWISLQTKSTQNTSATCANLQLKPHCPVSALPPALTKCAKLGHFWRLCNWVREGMCVNWQCFLTTERLLWLKSSELGHRRDLSASSHLCPCPAARSAQRLERTWCFLPVSPAWWPHCPSSFRTKTIYWPGRISSPEHVDNTSVQINVGNGLNLAFL